MQYGVSMFKFKVAIYCFQKNGVMSKVDVGALDVYFNLKFVSMQLVNMKVPCRGGRKKDFGSIWILIEVSTTPSFIALDAYAFTSWFMTSSHIVHARCFFTWNHQLFVQFNRLLHISLA